MSGLDTSTSDHTVGPRRIWRRIFVCTGAAIALLIAGVAYRVHQRSRLENQITIGPETTVVLGPRAPDGLIDYVGAFNEQLSAGVTPDNNAVVPLLEAFGLEIIAAPHRAEYFRRLGIPPAPPTGDYVIHPGTYFQQHHEQFDPGFVDEREAFFADLEEIQGRLWLPDEFPEHAALLDFNAAPLDRIVEATERPRFYSPIVGAPMLMQATLPVQQECRTAVRLLTARSMRRAAAGDVDGAWNDLLACHRLAGLVGQGGTLMDYLTAVALDATAGEAGVALVQSQRLSAAQAARCLADLDALPPVGDLVAIVDQSERWEVLGIVHRAVRGDDEAFLDNVPAGPLSNAGVDWDLVLRLVNRHFDRLVAVMEIEDFAEHVRAANDFTRELERSIGDSPTLMDVRVAAILGRTTEISSYLGHGYVATLAPSIALSAIARARADARRQLGRTAFALAAFHADHGAYPAALDELVAAHLREVPPDPFTAAALHYERIPPDGYRLYSFGENMTDDGGLTHESTPRGDDIPIEPRRSGPARLNLGVAP